MAKKGKGEKTLALLLSRTKIRNSTSKNEYLVRKFLKQFTENTLYDRISLFIINFPFHPISPCGLTESSASVDSSAFLANKGVGTLDHLPHIIYDSLLR
jgi:hypothetical protein